MCFRSAAGSMKLGFKSSLTEKWLPHINLRAGLNRSLGPLPVLPFLDSGDGHAKSDSERASLLFRPVRTEHRRRLAFTEWHPCESSRSPLPAPRHAGGAAGGDCYARGSPAMLVAGEHFR